MTFTWWLMVACMLVLSMALVRLRERRRALRRAPGPPARSEPYPSLTVVHPVRGLDEGARENIAAALAVQYPGEIEDIFVLDDEREPVLPLIRAAIAEQEASGHRGRARVLIAGPPRPGYTGKLSAMHAGVAVAKGEIVAFCDSDVRVDRDILRSLVDSLLGDPKAGCVFAPVIVSEPAHSAGDVGYQLMLNSLYSPEVAVWNHKGKELPFIMGQLMVFRRATLRALGGVDIARGQLVDDMHIGTHVIAAGLRNVMSPRPIRLIEQDMTFPEFAKTARRWLVFSRSGIPARFGLMSAFHYLAFWLGFTSLFAGVSTGAWPAALSGVALLIAASAILLALNTATGGPRVPVRWWWMPAFLFVAVPVLYVTTWLRPHVNWRGRVYDLNAKAELNTEPEPILTRIRRYLHA